MGPHTLRLDVGIDIRRRLPLLQRIRGAVDGDRFLFGALLVLILSISVHDAILVVLNHGVIGDVEQNPVGRWLLRANHGDVWLFVGVKLLGTAAAGAVAVEVFRLAPRIARIVVIAVAAIQLSLLAYLSLA